MDWNDPEQRREYHRDYYLKNRISTKPHSRKLNLDWSNPEEVQDYQQQYRDENTEKIQELHRSWYTHNREKALTQRKESYAREKALRPPFVPLTPKEKKRKRQQYYRENSDSEIERVKAYFRAHPEKVREISKRHRARKWNAEVCDFTLEQWTELKAVYNHRCAYCGILPARLTQDHLTPLSKGGNHTLHNIVPSCQSCNSHKHAGPPLPFTHFLRAQVLSNYWITSPHHSTKLRRSLRSLRPSSRRLRSDFIYLNSKR